MQRASTKSNRSDARALDATLLKLRLPGWIWRGAVLLVALLLWIWVCNTILVLGGMISYAGLETLGPEVVKILTRINPYLWWGVVAILTLIALSIVRAWLVRSSRHLRARIVPLSDVQKLTRTLSREGVEVLQWAWDATNNPVTIGDLLFARNEIRGGRVRKLALARAQSQALAEALGDVDTPASPVSLNDRLSAEPSISPSSAESSEPTISVIDEPEPSIPVVDVPAETETSRDDSRKSPGGSRDGKVEPVL